ncbi:unnamed protein product [Discula destructiva]
MAGFFQAFRTSGMPKRLLRYALAKFDIFDDDALDLENLDLGFGFKNTFEFKDVGLKVDKLTKQLALPTEYRIKKAKVSRLQITVPLDLYSSSIELIATGVHISLEISSSDSRQKNRGKEQKTRGADLVPTAADLAQSFLETQPNQEKRALEEALAAENQDLGASVTSSEDGSEEELAFGTGQGLSLPVFLTDFLQGVVDRTRVIINDVALHLDVEVPVEPKSPETELVSIRLSLDEMHVEGVTTLAQGDDHSKIVPKEGKRHILLNDIRASLITQSEIFSSLTRSPSMTSAPSISPVITQRSPSSKAESFSLPAREPASSVRASSDGSSSPQIEDSEAALQIPYDTDTWSGAEDNREEQPEPHSSLSTPRASIYHEFSGPDESRHSPQLAEGTFPWQPTLARSALENLTAGDDTEHDEAELEHSVPSDQGSDSSGESYPEDLSHSQYFSHEQAESMYLSALSQGQHQRVADESMPGSWDFRSSPESSPKAALEKSRTLTPPVPSSGLKGDIATQSTETDSFESTPSSVRGQSSVDQIGDRSVPVEVTPKPSMSDLAFEAEGQGPARLVKEIIFLESISIYVPTKHRHIHVSAADEATLGKSDFQQIPGAFSMHSPMSQSSSAGPDHEPQRAERDSGDDSIEIHLTPVECRFDSSIGFLLAMVLQRLLEASKRPQRSPEPANPAANQAPAASLPNCVLSMQKLSILFIEQIVGVADNAANMSKPSPSAGHTLLRAELQDIRATCSQTEDSRDARINIGRLCFGYHDSNILAFDRDAEMRKSIMINILEAGSDVSAHLSMTKERTLLEVQTLPLQVNVDLHRLDETLTLFGGLSGFLQMGASMTSDASRGRTPAKRDKPRGVRFDLPAEPDSTKTVHETVTSVRIGGLKLDLVGKVCGISVVTSAVKITGNQNDKIRLQISKIQVSGPHHKSSSHEAPVTIVMKNTRLNFLDTPRDADLDRLLALIVPSEGQFEDEADDIMVDTLLRQRRKASVLDLQVDHVQVQANQLHQLDSISALGEELGRLGAVAKYLPEDDRPGLLTMGLVQTLEVSVVFGGRIGTVDAFAQGFEVTHIALPALVAFAVQKIKVERNSLEELIGSSHGPKSDLPIQSPTLMVRMIADQMEPVIKVRMRNMHFEYRVPTLMDLMNLSSETTPQEFDAMLAASVVNLGDRAHHALVGSELPRRQFSAASGNTQAKPTVVNVGFRDCVVGLNPLGLTSKLAIVLVDAHVEAGIPVDSNVNIEADLKRVALLLIDDVSLIDASDQRPGPPRHSGSDARKGTDMVSTMCSQGYVSICNVRSAKATVQVSHTVDEERLVDVELRDDLLLLETCADSTHTLMALAGALKPPTPPSREEKYQTETKTVQRILANVAENFFGTAEGDYDVDADFMTQGSVGGDSSDGELIDASPLDFMPRYSGQQEIAECMFDATSSSIMPDPDARDAPAATADAGIQVHDNFFVLGPPPQMVARRWDAKEDTFEEVDEATLRTSPLKVRVRDVHVLWNLFDGYDWEHTRDAIAKNVEVVQTQAIERRTRSARRSLEEPDSDDEAVVGDCLFNSIYISIPSRNDPRDLIGGINHQLDDDESVACTTITNTTARTGTGQFRSKSKKLKLRRSRDHKISFELRGINIDIVQFPPPCGQKRSLGQSGFLAGQTLVYVDVRVNSLEIFDRMPTSTWKKFATYDFDAGERELESDMVHLELGLLQTKTQLAALDHVLRVKVLPLRLHVDQDALDFITRFFQFKDDSQAPAYTSPSDEAFIQRAEIHAIPIKLDFKPKRVDYAGLRAGRTSEFMNFVTLEGSCLTLQRMIIHGHMGWANVGQLLNDQWTSDVIKSQLGGVLAGVGPGRHIVTMGQGVRDLLEIPMREYKKDGRIVRGIGLGAAAFAQKTGTEFFKLGAKVAIGTQNVLQNAEGMLTGTSGGGGSSAQTGWGDEEAESEEKKQISLYADQPIGVAQGFRSAYSSLVRDLSTARDAIIAVPAEVMESGNARGAAAAVMRRAPTIIFRPAIGASRAVGQALMGANNTMDPKQLRRMEDKYKPGR